MELGGNIKSRATCGGFYQGSETLQTYQKGLKSLGSPGEPGMLPGGSRDAPLGAGTQVKAPNTQRMGLEEPTATQVFAGRFLSGFPTRESQRERSPHSRAECPASPGLREHPCLPQRAKYK